MTYLKINNTDYSTYVNKLKITREHSYKSQTNAAGNTVVKYITTKRVIDVGIIPLDAATMASLQNDINGFKVTVSYLDPNTEELQSATCIIPKTSVEYYTVRAGNTSFKAFTFQLKEL